MNNSWATDFYNQTFNYNSTIANKRITDMLNKVRGYSPGTSKPMRTSLAEQSRSLSDYEDMFGTSIGTGNYSAYYLRPINLAAI